MRLQPSCCFAGNSMLSQESHCTNRIAGSRPLVPSGRVRIVRSRVPSGASEHAVAAVETRNHLERPVLAARKVARQRRFGEGTEWQAAGERKDDQVPMHGRGVSACSP